MSVSATATRRRKKKRSQPRSPEPSSAAVAAATTTTTTTTTRTTTVPTPIIGDYFRLNEPLRLELAKATQASKKSLVLDNIRFILPFYAHRLTDLSIFDDEAKMYRLLSVYDLMRSFDIDESAATAAANHSDTLSNASTSGSSVHDSITIEFLGQRRRLTLPLLMAQFLTTLLAIVHHANEQRAEQVREFAKCKSLCVRKRDDAESRRDVYKIELVA